ncbi:PREDICTED: uncharacterized protein LOC104813322 [Tarenaya hassleriana]|uniref:uncharacterized protein LOC104813322 n=1 Tax=Tarenaya hassleriana TaxID=28532 RepID=UPI00053C9F07|nr:PREDICTED: uncharacterized protein LOC104813322 [Tarenaya hassleriana]
METLKPKSSIRSKSKIARTFQKVCSLRSASSTKVSSNNGIGICVLKSRNHNFDDDEDDGDSVFDLRSTVSSRSAGETRDRRRAVLEAVVAKIFASATAIKAAYAELQMAQRPYDNAAIQAADQAVVDELKALSELKRSFLKKELNLSPQVTIMLAEIQEQQSLMRTYEITIKKLESDVGEKQSKIDSMKKKLNDAVDFNKSLEKKLTASGSLSLFDNFHFHNLNFSHFVQILSYTLRSIRGFAKTMVKEMESSQWDLDAAAAAASSAAVFAKPSHLPIKVCVLEAYIH